MVPGVRKGSPLATILRLCEAAWHNVSKLTTDFESNGFVVVKKVVPGRRLDELLEHCNRELPDGPGRRNLLDRDWALELAKDLTRTGGIRDLLPRRPVPIQCTFFRKTETENWLVPPHRDTRIPAVVPESSTWRNHKIRDGIKMAEPSMEVLESLVAVRVHFEDNNEQNGALRIVPGSHREDEIDGNGVTCVVPRGGALVMRPLVYHSSSKLKRGSRNVLHFLYGPGETFAPKSETG